MTETAHSDHVKTVTKLVAFAVGMFAFGFALVPLYSVFCDITGLNGKTGRLSAAEAGAEQVDTSRWVTVEFIGNVNDKLPWRFRPVVRSMKVHPGQAYDATFTAMNTGSVDLVGQAVPSVAPSEAARYFNKTECFCFTQQEVKAGEEKAMPLRFIVDANLPAHVRTISLAYTFFPAQGDVVAARGADSGPPDAASSL
jgi:cytochrome c oxidase assembly protein subunit 11